MKLQFLARAYYSSYHCPIDVFGHNGLAISHVGSVVNHHLTPAKHVLELALEDLQVVHLSTGEGASERDNIARLHANNKFILETGLSSLVSTESKVDIIIPRVIFMNRTVCSIHCNKGTVVSIAGKVILPSDLWTKKKEERNVSR